ncbi:MAG: cytochrome C [Gemmatimonadota bacterium]
MNSLRLLVTLSPLASLGLGACGDRTTPPSETAGAGCLSCHEGIEPIREESSPMAVAINGMGRANGDPAGCVVCHGGTPTAGTAGGAHAGAPEGLKKNGGPQTFYPDPGSIWIAEHSCGQCHAGYVYRMERALMATEAGKIQGTLHTFGLPEAQDYQVPYADYHVVDTDGPTPSVGTEAYKAYMVAMKARHVEQFPDELAQLPQVSPAEVEQDPKRAAFTYLRQQCQRCHVGVRGRSARGDYRGMGCSACHILYSNDGFYEGNDPTIPKDEPGHMLSHRIHGTREAGNGIPVEVCNSCHNRGKRIGTTYQGLMEFPYGSPVTSQGGKQPKLHTKQYLFISDDLHHQIESRPENPSGGLLCQDCHTTVDIHGDGNIFGTTLAQVEIECQDCHGTPVQYPWELPLGTGEEFERPIGNTPRGLAEAPLPETSTYATRYDARDGFLLTARGNPFGNVVKDGDRAILHSATGNDFQIPLLKRINEENSWKDPFAKVAMETVEAHARKLECYACHSSWAPQCYGCHVEVDYSGGKKHVDWIASGDERFENGQTAESRLDEEGITSAGDVAETRSYLRWETPVLGIDGEGRVSPLMPGCQVVFSVIGRDGEPVAVNQIAVSPDEARAIGQERLPLAIDMSPVQPHSAQRQARTCESCHNSAKALGYGIEGGVFQTRYAEEIVEDLIDQRTGEPIPKRYQVQIPKIEKLTFDWSRIVDPVTGDQVATVGTHWPLSRALPREMRQGIERTGLCTGCHREMTNRELWRKVNENPTRVSDEQHMEVMNKLLRAYAATKGRE